MVKTYIHNDLGWVFEMTLEELLAKYEVLDKPTKDLVFKLIKDIVVIIPNQPIKEIIISMDNIISLGKTAETTCRKINQLFGRS